jgi:XTP/dITP diphosphohydrolase
LEILLDLPSQIIIATRNRHKAIEFSQIFGPQVSLLTARDLDENLGWDETGDSFEANAKIKISAVSKAAERRNLQSWILADDSGLCVDALDGAPGIYSSRFGGEEGNDEKNNLRLLNELKGMTNRSATFYCCIVLQLSGKFQKTFFGKLDGHILEASQGVGGFGYDSLFVPKGMKSTLAELSLEQKGLISHRSLAIEALRSWLCHNC